ncbi:MAG: hypothetical protein IT435_02225 [Phycisphaerales bacterium]|nr:hypothetical protein [Phycisphaerales bacterium]
MNPTGGTDTHAVPSALARTAYYTDGIAWGRFNWPKSMLLFFEKVAVLVPDAEQDSFERSDEAVIAGLREHDVLRVLRPTDLVDSNASNRIIKQVRDAANKIPDAADPDAPMLLYLEKLGNGPEAEQVKELANQLHEAGVAKPFVYGQSMIIRPGLGYLVLDAIAREASRTGQRLGLDLHPSRCVGTQRDLFPVHRRIDMCPGATVVHTDLEEVGVDLGSVPIGEILDFKKQNADLLDRYRVGLREFSSRLAEAPFPDRDILLRERRESIRETQDQLKSAYRDWRKLAAIGLGLGGVAWTVSTGDLVGGGLALGAAGIEMLPSSGPLPTRLTYLVKAAQTF